jgi:uncharacterized cupredoxin-like copper-binding protein
MKRLWVAAAPLVVLLVLGAAACGSSSNDSNGSGPPGSASGNPTVEASFDDTGCQPTSFDLPAGRTTFHVKNSGASSITEIELLDSNGAIVGEKENLTPGLDGTFTVNLTAGAQYSLACPGGTEHAVVPVHVEGGADDHGSAAGSTCTPAGDPSTAASHLAVALQDFTITPATPTAAAGTVSFDATNAGTHPHEIVVVKGVTADELPRADDGSIDEDKLPAGSEVGELEAFAPGNACSAVFDLTPGSYTLFCNVVGQSEGPHAKLGMITTLTVS